MMQVTSEVTTSDPQSSFYAFYHDRLDFDDDVWSLNSSSSSSSSSYSHNNQSFFDTATASGSPITPPRPPSDFVEWHIARKLVIFVAPLLLIIGASGNGLSFLILRSCSFRKCSIAFTLSALALVDTSVLFTTLGRHWIMYVTDGYDVRTLLWSFGCKVHFFLTYYLGQLSSWTLVVVTVERVICVSMPFFARTACTKSRIALSWVLVAVLLFVLNAHFFWTAEYFEVQVPTTTPNKTRLATSCFIGWRYRDFFYDVWYWIDFSLLSTIPFVFIIVGNVVISVCVVRAMNFRLHQTPVGTPSPSLTPSSSIQPTSKPLTSSTAMLIGIGVLFLVATTPSAVYFVLSDWWIGDARDAHAIARARLAFAATNLLHFANNALNFILYCLTGSRFRRAFVDQFRRKTSAAEPKSNRGGAVFTVGTRTSNNFVQATTGNCEL